MWNIQILLGLLKDFGVGITGWAVVIALLWKIMTNHLKHLSDSNKRIETAVGKVAKDLKENTRMTNELGQRVSKLEGKLEVKVK
jgi:hypothetical protein